MSDLISRADAIDVLIETIAPPSITLDTLVMRIDAIPSAQPERKTGRWYMECHTWFCDQCGKSPTKGMGYVQGTNELYSYCPHCGADMRGGDSE